MTRPAIDTVHPMVQGATRAHRQLISAHLPVLEIVPLTESKLFIPDQEAILVGDFKPMQPPQPVTGLLPRLTAGGGGSASRHAVRARSPTILLCQ